MTYTTISATEFTNFCKQGKALNILDVRTAEEHKEVHLLNPHQQIPVDELTAANAKFAKDEPLYLLCGGGKRATRAAEKLSSEGYTNCIVVEGGLKGCVSCGAEVKRKKVMPLRNQLRIAIGGILLFAYVIDWDFLVLVAGAGLVYSGVANKCYLEEMLAKAPWNKGLDCSKEGGACSTKIS